MKKENELYFKKAKTYDEDLMLRSAVSALYHFGVLGHDSSFAKGKFSAFQESSVCEDGKSIMVCKHSLLGSQFFEVKPEIGKVLSSDVSFFGMQSGLRTFEIGDKLKEFLKVTADECRESDEKNAKAVKGQVKAKNDGKGK